MDESSVKKEESMDESVEEIDEIFVADVKVNRSKKCCSVPGCSRRPDTYTSLHSFPSTNYELQHKWLKVCKLRLYNPHLKVCSDHFNIEDFKTWAEFTNVVRRTLNKDVVPSLKLPTSAIIQTLFRTKRNTKNFRCGSSTPEPPEASDEIIQKTFTSWCDLIEYEGPTEPADTEDKSVQVNLNRSPKGIWIVIVSDASLMVWTCIRTFTLLAALEECTKILLDEDENNSDAVKNDTAITLEEQIVLVFIKLKTNLSFLNIASLFDITENQVSVIFKNLLPTLQGMFKSDRWRDKLEKKNSPLYELLYRDIKLK